MTKKRKSIGVLSFGLMIVLVGLTLVLLNLGILSEELRPILISWQMLLIAIGLLNLCHRSYIGGMVLILVGTFFLFPRVITAYPEFFAALNPNFVQNFWPLLLIIAGLIVIGCGFGHRRRRDWAYSKKDNDYSFHQENVGSSFDKSVVFSGGEYIVLDPVFTGGELNAIFGGINLDLRKTSLPEGDTYLEVNAIFGGVSLIIPDDWCVKSNVTSIMGGLSDQRHQVVEYQPDRRLILNGGCIFGGTSIDSTK